MNHLKTQIRDFLGKSLIILKQDDLTDEQINQVLNNIKAVIKLLSNV